ncbi:UPF0147 family protein [Candidatus Woesearchaeota archaeon]|nr:UPF0147 family protein [Candidatus Woesearchaeota archaeon]
MQNTVNTVDTIVGMLSQIQEDFSVPKSIRDKIKSTISILADSGADATIKCDRSLQELDDIASDPAIPVYIRTQIWNILSILESDK